MKLWTDKKLKIGGDIMASQKLMFLKKIDPKRAIDVVAKLRGAGSNVPAEAKAPSGEPTSSEAFAVIKDYIESNAGLAAEIGKTFLFRLSAPDSAWIVDLKNGKGSVAASTAAGRPGRRAACGRRASAVRGERVRLHDVSQAG
jgi:3-hydroxyacyl-CoA dehydrogenase/3a,7a,12a-trihydroxy-5b-cholest-24-enoyl-CoA hydratase